MPRDLFLRLSKWISAIGKTTSIEAALASSAKKRNSAEVEVLLQEKFGEFKDVTIFPVEEMQTILKASELLIQIRDHDSARFLMRAFNSRFQNFSNFQTVKLKPAELNSYNVENLNLLISGFEQPSMIQFDFDREKVRPIFGEQTNILARNLRFRAALLQDVIFIGPETPTCYQGYTPINKESGAFLEEYTLGLKDQKLVEYQYITRIDDGERSKRDQVFVLPGAFGNRYYHVIINIVPCLLLYKILELDCPIVIPKFPIDIQPSIDNVIDYGFSSLFISKNKLVRLEDISKYYFNQAIMPHKLHASPLTGVFYRNFVQMIEGKGGRSAKRIYISRQKAARRPIANESAVVEVLKDYDFQIVFAEDLSFEEQVACFAAADIIVSPHGAGLANAVFSHSRVAVIELMTFSPPKRFFENICLQTGKEYACIQCRSAESESGGGATDDWYVDLGELRHVMDQKVPATQANN